MSSTYIPVAGLFIGDEKQELDIGLCDLPTSRHHQYIFQKTKKTKREFFSGKNSQKSEPEFPHWDIQH
mgnify:CR=1 FL=1